MRWFLNSVVRRAVALAVLAACQAVMVAPVQAAGADPVPELLVSARQALGDGLYDLAQTRAAQALDAASAATEKAEAVDLLLDAYDRGRAADALRKSVQAYRAHLLGDGGERLVSFWQGRIYLLQERYADALAELERAGGLPLHRRSADALTGKAVCLEHMGRVRDAIDACTVFQSVFAGHPAATANLLRAARLQEQTNDVAGAIANLRQVVACDGVDELSWQARLRLARLLERQDGGRSALAVLAPFDASNCVATPRAWLDGALLAARIRWDTGQTNEAVALLSRTAEALAGTPLAASAQLELGTRQIAAGGIDPGRALLRRVVSECAINRPDLAGPAQLQLAASMLARREYEPAAVEFMRYIESFTNQVGLAEAERGRGWALYHTGNHAAAAAHFLRAGELQTNADVRAECMLKAADAFYLAGDNERAVANYRQVLTAYTNTPWAATAAFQLGETLARLGRNDEAESLLQQLVDGADAGLAARAMLRIAEIARDSGRGNEAAEMLQRVMNTFTNGPVWLQALHARALLNYDQYRFEAALADFAEVQRRGGTNDIAVDAAYRQALCRYWLGDDEAALLACRAFVAEHPASELAAPAVFWVGKHLFNRGDYKEAQAAFAQFRETYRAHPLAAAGLLWAGRAAASQREYVQAIEMLAGMAERFPDSKLLPEARFCQAESLFELGRYSEAILLFDELIHKNPEHALRDLALMRKGDSQFTLGAENPARYAEAIASYRAVAAAAENRPDLALEADYKIGRSLQKLGKEDDAFEQYYLQVIQKYLRSVERRVWYTEDAKRWFTRAANDAADIQEARGEFRRAVNILEYVGRAGVPGRDEARERIERMRGEHWWMFY